MITIIRLLFPGKELTIKWQLNFNFGGNLRTRICLSNYCLTENPNFIDFGIDLDSGVFVQSLNREGIRRLSAVVTSCPTVGLGCFKQKTLQNSRNFCSNQLFQDVVISSKDRRDFVIVLA